MRRTLKKASVVAVVALASIGIASGAAAARASQGHASPGVSSSWTQHTVCPATGMVVTLQASHVQTRPAGPGGEQHVTGQILASSSAGHSTRLTLDYRVGSGELGSSVVRGSSVEILPGGAPVAVEGTAYLAPDGFLGRYTGRADALCATLAA